MTIQPTPTVIVVRQKRTYEDHVLPWTPLPTMAICTFLHSRSACHDWLTVSFTSFSPRDGMNLTPKMLLNALQHPNTYHCSAPLARVLVWGGFFLLGKDWKFPKTISLHDLALHNRIEHNASVVHRNTPRGHKYAPVDVDVELLEHFLKEDWMTIERIARRRVELEVASPLDGLHSEIARGEWSLVLGIFGKANKGRINSDILNVWLQENRFVTGWKPSHRQNLIHTVATSFKIREKMNQFRPLYMKASNETRRDFYIQRALAGEKTEKA